MVLLFGGEFFPISFLEQLLTLFYSLTKLMGESFKLHAQALVGYEDSLQVAKDQPLHPMPTKSLASVGTAY